MGGDCGAHGQVRVQCTGEHSYRRGEDAVHGRVQCMLGEDAVHGRVQCTWGGCSARESAVHAGRGSMQCTGEHSGRSGCLWGAAAWGRGPGAADALCQGRSLPCGGLGVLGMPSAAGGAPCPIPGGLPLPDPAAPQEGPAELIFYERPDAAGPKLSQYSISRTDDPEGLEAVLARALGVLGVVKKERLLYLVGQTRVHLDSVEGLGDFLELEVVLSEDQSPEQGELVARELMKELGVEDGDLLTGAYLDLLLARGQPGS
uniref:CYTH domain-containing protein n=1 Tax=Apteryx owenii TaxID=8824 RepID=A0A8B9S613_APTOW